MHVLHFCGPWRKWPGMAPNGARRMFSLLIQTLPTFWAERIWILRFLIFEYFLDPKLLDFQVPRYPKSGPAKLGLGRARLEPSGQENVDFYCKYWCLSSRPPVSSRRDEHKCHQVQVFPDQNEWRVPLQTFQGPFTIPLNSSSQALFGNKFN